VRVLILCVLVGAAACSTTSGGPVRQYEYEEEMYLSLDGSATVYVHSSIAALNALRGTSFDTQLKARIDREAVGRFFTTPSTRVMRVTTSRRRGRQYVHVRLETDDVRTLAAAGPFSWSSYSLARPDETVVYKQAVAGGVSSLHPDRTADWTGDELIAFRVHVPSVVEYQNAGPDNLRRGNIVVWEQSLQDRLRGEPLELEVQMQPRSILYRTLILFASMLSAVALLFGVVIWRVVRAGQKNGG
jgi:hypothetical protein